MIDFIDEEEKELIESLHSEKWVSDFDDEIKKMYEDYAKNYLTIFTSRSRVMPNLS